jgi:hypothetical protein
VNITSDTSWDYKLLLPIKNTTTFPVPEHSGYTTAFVTAIDVGSRGNTLNLSSAAKITFTGQVNKRAAWTSGSTTGLAPLIDITTVCTNTTSGAGVPNGSACYGNSEDGKDLVVWTYHFSTFVLYTATAASSTPTTSPSGSSGGGNITTGFWTVTYYPLVAQLSSGYNQQFAAKTRAMTNQSITEFVGVRALTATTATIEFPSAKEFVLNIGDEKKYDIKGDGYYDLSVKLNSIASNKADMTIKTIHEAVSSGVVEEEKKAAETTTPEAQPEAQASKTNSSTWIIILFVVAVAVVLIYFLYKRRRYSHRGY